MQPAEDTLVITMTGAVAGCAAGLKPAEAALDFYQQLQFAIEFSEPGCTGQLVVQATVNGLLRAKGKRSSVGMLDATTTLSAGPHEIGVLSLPTRMLCDGDAMTVTASHRPCAVRVCAGCFCLSQHFRIAASQNPGLGCCCKASAEFSPSGLSDDWTSSPDPFHGVDKSNLGYQVILQVIPDPVSTDEETDTDTASSFLLPQVGPMTAEIEIIGAPAMPHQAQRPLVQPN